MENVKPKTLAYKVGQNKKFNLLRTRYYSDRKGSKNCTSAEIEVDGETLNLIDLVPHTSIPASRFEDAYAKIETFVSSIKWRSNIKPLAVFKALANNDNLKEMAKELNISTVSVIKLNKELKKRIVASL